MQHGESGFESLLQGRNTRSLLSGNANGDGGFVFVELVENEEGDIEAKEEQQHSEQQESLHRPSTQETDRTREAATPKRAAGLMTYMRDVWGSRANSNQSSAGRNVKMNNVEEPEPLEDTDFSDNEASGYGDHDVESDDQSMDPDCNKRKPRSSSVRTSSSAPSFTASPPPPRSASSSTSTTTLPRASMPSSPSSPSSSFLQGFRPSLKRPTTAPNAVAQGRRPSPSRRFLPTFSSSNTARTNTETQGTLSGGPAASTKHVMIHQRRVPKTRSECNRIPLGWFEQMEPQGSTWARLIQQKCDESLAVSAVPLAFEDTDCESKDLDECSESTPWSIGPEANDELALDKEPAEGGSPLHLATNQGEEGTFLGETQSAASSLSPRSLSSKSSKAASQSLASFVVEQKEAASIDGWSTVQSSPKRIYSKFSFDASHEDDVNNLDDDDDVSTDTERSASPRNHGHPPLQEGEIERDVPRTYPTLSLFQNARVQRRLVNALGNIALDNPDMGYVQGMNYVMAQLLLHFPQPAHAAEETFKALIDAPAYNLRGLYSPGLHMLRSMVDRLRQLVRKLRPGLFARLQALDLDSLHFTFNWFITLFSYTMPFEVLADVWGLFFEQSWAAIFRVSLVLLATVEVDLLRADFETATLILRAAPTFPRKDLINQAKRVPLTPHDERDIRDLVFMDCV